MSFDAIQPCLRKLLSGPFPFRLLLGAAPDAEVVLSDGVETLYNEHDLGAVAWVARGPWRPPSLAERAALLAEASPRWADHLVLVPLPPELLTFAHRALVEPLAATSGARNDALARAIRDFRTSFRKALHAAGYALDDAGPADVVVNRPNLRSTAYDYARDRMVGLHIDNHQALPLEERARSFILSNINIGWNPRYVDVIPASVATLLAASGLGPSCDLAPREIKDAYLRASPETPVVRVTVPPGTAYLLNTQNCIHDGATPPGDAPDVAFLAMGNSA